MIPVYLDLYIIKFYGQIPYVLLDDHTIPSAIATNDSFVSYQLYAIANKYIFISNNDLMNFRLFDADIFNDTLRVSYLITIPDSVQQKQGDFLQLERCLNEYNKSIIQKIKSIL